MFLKHTQICTRCKGAGSLRVPSYDKRGRACDKLITCGLCKGSGREKVK